MSELTGVGCEGKFSLGLVHSKHRRLRMYESELSSYGIVNSCISREKVRYHPAFRMCFLGQRIAFLFLFFFSGVQCKTNENRIRPMYMNHEPHLGHEKGQEIKGSTTGRTMPHHPFHHAP